MNDTPIWNTMVKEKKIDMLNLMSYGEADTEQYMGWMQDVDFEQMWDQYFYDRRIFADGMIVYEEIAEGKELTVALLTEEHAPLKHTTRGTSARRKRTRKGQA
jgi:hypothetical protein